MAWTSNKRSPGAVGTGGRVSGEATAVIGYDESEVLDVVPVGYFVRVTKREKRACRHCPSRTVVAAPLPERIIPKGLVSNRVIVDTLVKKYYDHLPLYRHEQILAREAGVEISRTTMDGWVMQVGEMLLPVREAMRRDLLTSTYLQADETWRRRWGAHPPFSWTTLRLPAFQLKIIRKQLAGPIGGGSLIELLQRRAFPRRDRCDPEL